MKTVKFTALLLAVFAGVSLLSCKKDAEQDAPQTEGKSVSFTVALNAMSENQAEIIVRHNGANSDSWFGFVTEDLEKDASELIAAQLVNVTKKTLHIGKTQTVLVKDLAEYSKYRYIAFGVNADKEVYGKPGSLVFTTNPNLNVNFSATLAQAGATTVKFNITHDGKDALEYYAFATDDATTEASVLAAAKLSDITELGKLKSGVTLLSGKNLEYSVSELTADKEYRFIVFGVFVADDKKVAYYGTPADLQFRTEVDYANVLFDIQPVSVRKASASFKVSYDTESDITWYAFNSADLQTPVSTLVTNAVKNITEQDWLSGKQEVTVDGLSPLTEYRFIVTGIKADGVYAMPKVYTYTTADEDYDDIQFSAELVSAGKDNAVIKVTNSTAQDKFQWIYVVSQDLTSSASALLPKAEEVGENDIQSGAEKQIALTGLTAGTPYRFVVAGYRVDASGNKYIYGKTADITFNTTSGFTLNDSWVLQFNGKKVSTNGKWCLYMGIHNTGAKLGFKIFTKAEFEATPIIDPLVNAYVASVKADAAATGTELSKYMREDNASDTQSWLIYEGLAAGDYVAVIFDVDENFDPVGNYQKLAYTIEPSTATDAYNAWLGNWVTSSTEASEIWTITADIPGETYKVAGVCNSEVVVEAVFNPANGKFMLSSQTLDLAKTITSSGSQIPCHLFLFPMTSTSGGFYGGDRLICTGSITNGVANLTGGTISASSGTVNIVAMQFLWDPDDASNTSIYYYNKVTYAFPNTLQRPSDTGSAEYNAFLGDWDVIGRNVANTADSTFFTMSVAKNVADVSFAISSDWGILNNPKEVSMGYDPNKKALLFQSVELLHQVQVYSSDPTLYDVCICGFFQYTDGNTYFDSTVGSTMASITLSGGNATVTAGNWSTGMPFTQICGMAVAGDSGYRLWTAPLALPFKYKKSTATSSTSVPAPAVKSRKAVRSLTAAPATSIEIADNQ